MRVLKYLLYLSPLIIFVVGTTIHELKQTQLGSEENPIRIYITPALEANTISSSAKEMLAFLHAETGYYFTSAVPSSYVAVVEAFGSNKADVAIINTFSYLMAREKYGATALLRVVRDNHETTYRGQIVTRFDSGIDSLSQLNGKTFAYVDASSTSGYILPKAMLEKYGIKPAESMFAMKHDNVISMVYQGQVDAGATYYSPRDPSTGQILDARMRVQTQYPDVEKKVRIIALTEPIPNDPVIFRRELPEVMKQKIVAALMKFVSTPEGEKTLYRITDVRGFIPTTDADYDGLRNTLKALSISVENLGKK